MNNLERKNYQKSRWLGFVFAVAIVIVIIVGFWILWPYWHKTKAPASNNNTDAQSSQESAGVTETEPAADQGATAPATTPAASSQPAASSDNTSGTVNPDSSTSITAPTNTNYDSLPGGNFDER